VDTKTEELAHGGLNVDVYVHMTSPIRRIVDLLNMIQFQTSMNMISLSEKSIAFYENWTRPENIDYINSSHKHIRKVQNECELLEKFTNHPENLEKEYDGYVVDALTKNNSKSAYVVYLPELNTTLKIKSEEQLEKYKAYKCKVYVFNDEDALKKRIRGGSQPPQPPTHTR
jgi:exoribonuclease R